MGSAFLILIVGGLGGLVLWRMGAWLPASVHTFRRAAARYAIVLRPPLTERIPVGLLPLFRWLQEASNLQRLLVIAGRSESSAAFGLRLGGLTLLIIAGLLLLDLLVLLISGEMMFPAGIAFLVGLFWLFGGYLRLRIAAKSRQRHLELALGYAFTELAILTYTRQIPIPVALREVVAPSQVDGQLQAVLNDQRGEGAWKSPELGLPDMDVWALASSTTVYQTIANTMGVPAFNLLAGSLRRINDKGQSPTELLISMAASFAEAELAEMAVRAEKSRAQQALPVGLMIIPLLLLIGFPLVAGLAHVFS